MNSKGQLRRARLRGVFWALVSVALFAGLLYFTWPCVRFFLHAPDLDSFFNPSIAALDPGVKPFDQAKWDRGHATDRIAMGRCIAGDRSLIGMKREKLVAKLGPFEFESEHEDKAHLIWKLGQLDDGGLFMRNMSLQVEIEKSGTVVDADIFSTD